MRPERKLYFITNGMADKGFDTLGVVEKAVLAGVRAVQIREKGLDGARLFELAVKVKAIAAKYGAKVFVNDRIDVALASGAKGAHLGEAGMPVTDARRICPKGFLIGASAHSVEGALKAEADGADFVTLGPVYFTESKAAYGSPIGLEPVKKTAAVIRIPLIAIGGIKENNIGEVINAGASGVAVISAIASSKDPEKSAKQLLGALNA
ncbi:MAG: thiamine phosphate synthase [Deltaproteobacteria bacterium]|nr:thiamine phosphate synthase [Deltaproteobacteria bacterium]